MSDRRDAHRKTVIVYDYPNLPPELARRYPALTPDPTRQRPHRPGLLRRALDLFIVMPNWLAFPIAVFACVGFTLLFAAAVSPRASAAYTPITPVPTITPRSSATPSPSPTTTPSATPTVPPIVVEDGWFEWRDAVPGDIDLILYRAVDVNPRLDVFVCWTGETADARLSNGSIEQQLAVDENGEPVAVCVKATARFEPRSDTRLVGSLPQWLREALMGFPTTDSGFWALLRARVFFGSVPDGYVVKPGPGSG